MQNPIRPARLDRPCRRRRHPGDRVRHGEHVAVRHDRCQRGCGDRRGQRAASPPPPLVTPVPLPPDQPGPNGGVVVRWFVGLGAGGQPQQIAAEQAFVQAFNDRPPRRTRSTSRWRSTTTTSAASLLKTQIAAGNAPDIIGPVGVEGLNIFRDQLLDLSPLIAKSGFDTSKYDPALVDFFKLGEGGATIGVPFATYPSYALVQQEAVRRGQASASRRPRSATCTRASPGTWTRVRTLGMKLTVDKNGNDATQRRLRSHEGRPVGLRHAVRGQQPAC